MMQRDEAYRVYAKEIKLVKQEHAGGCGPATLAMILCMSYEKACEWLQDSPVRSRSKTIDWDNDGISHIDLDYCLNKAGWYHQRTYKSWEPKDNWPPKPFAPIHYVQVGQPSGNSHFVVMLKDGRVLDPLLDDEQDLDSYLEVHNVCGLVHPESEVYYA